MSLANTASAMYDGCLWFFQNLLFAFYNIGYAVANPGMWLDWSEKKSIMRFVYYGGSVEFFFSVLLIFLVLFFIGVFRPAFMWGHIRVLEGFANTVGRFFAWAGLIMVLQQVLIIVMQRIFTRPDIVIGFGIPLSYDISWYAEELKLYNALVVSLCATYTFVQGGHVRVDLFYAGAKFRTKKIVDMFGSIVFM
ncbi:MAG: C4-dicarboxylate ABC transporter permease, partial [Rhodobacteraceae bacterium TMED160]